MANTLRIWDKETPITLPTGEFAPAQIFEQFPYLKMPRVLIEETGEGIVSGLSALSAVTSTYQVDPTLPDDELLEAIKLAMERAQNPNYDEINEILDGLEQEDDDE